MEQPKILVVFFSRSGHTAAVAETIRRALEERTIRCDVERLRDRTSRAGVLGYLRSSFDATFDRPTALEPTERDPGDYNAVIVGTPVWNLSAAVPVRTYLRRNAARLRRVAVFLTYGGRGRNRVFAQLQRLVGQTAIAELAVREADLMRGKHVGAVRLFAERIADRVEPRVLRSATPAQSFGPS